MEAIKNAWTGNERLWKVFWIYGIILSIIIGFAANFVSGLGVSFIRWPFEIFYNLYALVVLVATWRCAFNTDWPAWGHLARAYVVLAICIFIYQISSHYA